MDATPATWSREYITIKNHFDTGSIVYKTDPNRHVAFRKLE